MLTEEHKQAADMVRRFAHTEIAPTIQDWDRKQEMNPDVLPRMGELGILGINIPVKYGGQGYDYVTLGLVCEELERVDTTLRVVMSVHMGLCSMALLQWGTEEQKQRFLTPASEGRKVRWIWTHRAGAWIRCGAPADKRQEGWRLLHPERRKDVDQPCDQSTSFSGDRPD
jgi:alkylation response protein AidB-like acyl-CoA dehydrogenase